MAKGGKGRKGGGGGGGKTRKYSRDNKGRFASTGSGGATARGGRLKTASGNKRKTQTITATGQKGVLAKPKGLKPESTNRLKTGIFISKRRAVNAQLANKPDQAVVNIPGRFTGRAGKSFDASITRAVATVKASKDAKFKTKAEVKADQAKTKAAKEAKPKRVRSAESLRVSRAKQVEKRRSITTNPAGVRASAAAKMAANATRTQQRAAAFYKAGGKPAAAATAKPARFSASELAERKGYAKQLMAQPKGVRKANYLARKAQKNPDQLDRFKGRMKFGTQNTINNITEGRNYLTAKKSQFANTPEKRASIERSVTNSGRSLQARMKTTNLGTRLRRLNKPVTTRAAKTKGTIGKPKGLKPGNIKPKAAAKPAAPKALTPAERIKIKTPIIRAKRANRASVVTPGQRSRLETGKGAKIKGARLNSSVAKPRTAGNTKPQVASRVKRKLAAENAKMNQIQRRERIGARQGKQYERSLKREMLLERAKTFLESGKLPGKDNSIAAQRNTKQARQRLAAKNAERRNASAKPAAPKTKKARTDESAFGDRYKRAGKVGLKRSIKESDNLNNPTGKATFEKRFAATQQRQSQADRTAAAAKDFYSRFGSPMSFAQRPKLSTAGGARFGVKKKPARKPRSMR